MCHDLPFCTCHCLVRDFCLCLILINLKIHTVIYIRSIFLQAAIFYLFPSISSGTDCLSLQSLLMIGRRHFTWHHPLQISFQRQLIDQIQCFLIFGLLDLQRPLVGRIPIISLYGCDSDPFISSIQRYDFPWFFQVFCCIGYRFPLDQYRYFSMLVGIISGIHKQYPDLWLHLFCFPDYRLLCDRDHFFLCVCLHSFLCLVFQALIFHMDQKCFACKHQTGKKRNCKHDLFVCFS